MKLCDVLTASALRMGILAASGRNSSETRENLTLGGYYVLCRIATTWLGNKVISRLLKDSPADDQNVNLNRDLFIKSIVHASLLIPTIAMSYKLTKLSARTSLISYEYAFKFMISSAAITTLFRLFTSITFDSDFIEHIIPTSFICVATMPDSKNVHLHN